MFSITRVRELVFYKLQSLNQGGFSITSAGIDTFCSDDTCKKVHYLYPVLVLVCSLKSN